MAKPRNMSYEVKGNKLHIEADLTADLGPSRTGSSEMVATSGGNVPIGGKFKDVYFALNVFRQEEGTAG